MSKGWKTCLGCLGCGCLTVILLVIGGGFYGYRWCNTTGKTMLVEGVETVSNQVAEAVLEPESAAEVASLTAELRDDIKNEKISVLDCFKYAIVDNASATQKIQSTLIFAVLNRKAKGSYDNTGNKSIINEDNEKLIKSISFALQNGQIDFEETEKYTKKFLNSGKETKGNKLADDKAVLEAFDGLKKYADKTNLPEAPESFSVDATTKAEIIKYINNLRAACKK